jgi:hypothetical protein
MTLKACVICGTITTGPRCPNHGGNRRVMTTTQRGYGHQHQQRRAALLPHAIGTPCPICGKTMHPYQPLALDHSTRLVDNPSSVGDRIVHAHCNNAAGGYPPPRTTDHAIPDPAKFPRETAL